ncbi:MAG TPA: hypothetical protein VF424_17580 [Vicinamibacterales bacterium]
MEQRPLRLGDIVDDYCPRERRITNHAIVALVGDAIRQTRCTTCDAEHVYKAAKMPRRKKSDATAALYEQVLTDATPAQRVPPGNDETVDPSSPLTAAAGRTDDPAVAADDPVDDAGQPGRANGAEAGDEPAQPDSRPDEVWSAHRPLIRATLPRTEGEPPAPRPIPEFTMHQRRTRGGQGFRHGGWQANGNQRGNGFNRPGRSGHGHGQGQGNGPGPHRHESGGRSGRRHGSRNKRSR